MNKLTDFQHVNNSKNQAIKILGVGGSKEGRRAVLFSTHVDGKRVSSQSSSASGRGPSRGHCGTARTSGWGEPSWGEPSSGERTYGL